MKALERRIKANRLGEIHLGLYPETIWLLKPGMHKISKETADHFGIEPIPKKHLKTFNGKEVHVYSGFSEILNGLYAAWRASEMMSNFYGRKIVIWTSLSLDRGAFSRNQALQHFPPRKIINAFKTFAERGWLEVQKGKVVTGVCTRFIPTQELIHLFKTCPDYQATFRKAGRDTTKVYTRIRTSETQERMVESDDALAFPEIHLTMEHKRRCAENKISLDRRKRVGKFVLPINQALRVSTFRRLKAETNQVLLNPEMVNKRKVCSKNGSELYSGLKAIPTPEVFKTSSLNSNDPSSKGRRNKAYTTLSQESNPMNISSYFGISKALHVDLVEVAKTLHDKVLRDKTQVAKDQSLDPSLFEVFRMFQASEEEAPFEAGGRLVSYAHGSFTRVERQRLRVNGIPTAEVDVNACQPRLLFSLIGESLGDSFYESIFPNNREKAKSLIMYFVGSKSPTHHGWERSRAALQGQFKPITKEEWARISSILTPVEHLLQSAWRKLQRAESDWLIEVISRYYKRFSDDVLLTWHDSIRVREDRVEPLKEIMLEVWGERFGTACILKVTPPPSVKAKPVRAQESLHEVQSPADKPLPERSKSLVLARPHQRHAKREQPLPAPTPLTPSPPRSQAILARSRGQFAHPALDSNPPPLLTAQLKESLSP